MGCRPEAATLDFPLASLFDAVTVRVQDSGSGPIGNATVNSSTFSESCCYVSLFGLSDDWSMSNTDSQVTTSRGNAVLHLWPTTYNGGSRGSYVLTAIPPSGSGLAVVSKSNVTFSSNDAETFILQFIHAQPVTTAYSAPGVVLGGTYGAPVSITLAATATTGFTVATTQYKLDGASAFSAYAGPIAVGTDGAHTITVQSTDSAGVYESPHTYSFTINLLKVTTTSLPAARLGVPYSATLAGTGGTIPYSWGLATGSTLPAWLTLASNGTLSGTPPSLASVSFTAQATDAASSTATRSLTLSVGPDTPPQNVTAGGPYSVIAGQSITLYGAATSPFGDPLTYSWDLDNNGSFETSGASVNFTAPLNSVGQSLPVSLQVCDPSNADAYSDQNADQDANANQITDEHPDEDADQDPGEHADADPNQHAYGMAVPLIREAIGVLTLRAFRARDCTGPASDCGRFPHRGRWRRQGRRRSP